WQFFDFFSPGCLPDELASWPYADYRADREGPGSRPPLTEREFLQLRDRAAAGDARAIIADQGMSENHLGGDDIISAVAEAVEAKDKEEAIEKVQARLHRLGAPVPPGMLRTTSPEVVWDDEPPEGWTYEDWTFGIDDDRVVEVMPG